MKSIVHEDIVQIKKDLAELKTIIRDSQVDFINQKRDFEIVGLPSCGVFYSGNPKTLYIGLLTYYEEILLTKPYFLQMPDLLFEILRRIIKNRNFDVTQLISCDVQAISMFLSAYSYGDEREIDIICPACDKKEEKYKFKISGFQAKDFYCIPDKNNEIEVKSEKHILKVKPMSFLEEHEFNKQNHGKIEKMVANIMELDGERNKEKIKSTVKKMKIMESRDLEKAVKSGLPEIESIIKFVCPFCSEESNFSFGAEGAYFLKMPETYLGTIKEEIFLINYYGHAVTIEDARIMTVSDRKWTLSRINEEVEKKNKAEQAAISKAKNSKK